MATITPHEKFMETLVDYVPNEKINIVKLYDFLIKEIRTAPNTEYLEWILDEDMIDEMTYNRLTTTIFSYEILKRFSELTK